MGQTPLSWPPAPLEMMKLLLGAGADPKAKAPDGGSFPMAAVGSANVEVVVYGFDNDVKVATTTAPRLMHASVTGAGGTFLAARLHVCDVISFLAEKGRATGRTQRHQAHSDIDMRISPH